MLSRPYVQDALKQHENYKEVLGRNLNKQLDQILKARRVFFVNVSQPNHLASILLFDQELYTKHVADIKQYYLKLKAPKFLMEQINPDLEMLVKKLK